MGVSAGFMLDNAMQCDAMLHIQYKYVLVRSRHVGSRWFMFDV